jgi:hypothetical protein
MAGMYWDIGMDHPGYEANDLNFSANYFARQREASGRNSDGTPVNTGAGNGGAAFTSGYSGGAAPEIQRTMTPQEIENIQHRTELNTYMQGDPTGGYGQKLQTMMNGSFSSDDPSYAWRFNQGQQAVERSAAARGLLGSGNAAIELQQYGQGAASQEYGSQFNRTLQALGQSTQSFQAGYTRLAELAGMTAGQQVAANSLNYNYANADLNSQLSTNQLNANTGLGYAQLASQNQYNNSRLSLERSQQQFGQDRVNNTDAAFQQMLSGYSGGSDGMSAWQRQQIQGQPQDNNSYYTTSPMVGYSSGVNPDFQGYSNGTGSWSSSSGGGGTFGGGY